MCRRPPRGAALVAVGYRQQAGSFAPTTMPDSASLRDFSGFMCRIHRNELTEVVWDMLEGTVFTFILPLRINSAKRPCYLGASINDDQQHTKTLPMDVSPLYFSINGAPGHVPSNMKATTVEWLLAHPAIDPNRGLIDFGSDATDGNYTRESPIMVRICPTIPHIMY